MYPGLLISYARSASQNENQSAASVWGLHIIRKQNVEEYIVMPTLVLNRKFVSSIRKNHRNPQNDEILKEKNQIALEAVKSW